MMSIKNEMLIATVLHFGIVLLQIPKEKLKKMENLKLQSYYNFCKKVLVFSQYLLKFGIPYLDTHLPSSQVLYIFKMYVE